MSGKKLKAQRNYYGNDPLGYLVKQYFKNPQNVLLDNPNADLSDDGQSLNWDKVQAFFNSLKGIEKLQGFGIVGKEMPTVNEIFAIKKKYNGK